MKPTLAEARDDGAEQRLLAAVTSIDSRLRDASLAGNRIHRDRAEAGREKGALGRGENRLSLAARIVPGERTLGCIHAGRRVHTGSLCVGCIERIGDEPSNTLD
jgi:hypothetical protein